MTLRRSITAAALAFAFVVGLSAVAAVTTRLAPPARAQVPSITQFPGATVQIAPKSGKTIIQSMVTFCPPGMFAISAGHAASGSGTFVITSSHVTQLPTPTEPGAWTTTVRVSGGPIEFTPFLTCLTAAQVPE